MVAQTIHLNSNRAGDINGNKEHGVKNGEHGLFLQILAHLGTDHFHPADVRFGSRCLLNSSLDFLGKIVIGLKRRFGTNQIIMIGFVSRKSEWLNFPARFPTRPDLMSLMATAAGNLI